MGSDRFYPEERPVREVSVEGFWIDRHPVTVAEFRRFVKVTGHVTWAEQAPRAEDYPDADEDSLVPGSLVERAAHEHRWRSGEIGHASWPGPTVAGSDG